jgi:phosphopantetheinyl transferase (holo-ACP synthase)
MTNAEKTTVRLTYYLSKKVAGKDAAKEALYKATLELLEKGEVTIKDALETLEEVNDLYYGG